jgi:hypothetical protein
LRSDAMTNTATCAVPVADHFRCQRDEHIRSGSAPER